MRTHSSLAFAGALLVGAVASLATARPAQAATGDLEYLTVTKGSQFLDGGTTVIEGHIHGAPVQIRYDLRMGSPTRGTVFISRDGGPESELPSEELAALDRGLARSKYTQDAVASLGRKLAKRRRAEGLEKVNPDGGLRAFRVTRIRGGGKDGYARDQLHMDGEAKWGSRMILLFGDRLLLSQSTYGYYDLPPREMFPSERADLLRALSTSAIARLPNRRTRKLATDFRQGVAAKHAAEKTAAAKRPADQTAARVKTR